MNSDPGGEFDAILSDQIILTVDVGTWISPFNYEPCMWIVTNR